MQIFRNKITIIIPVILCLLELSLFIGNPVYAQRKRRSIPTTINKPVTRSRSRKSGEPVQTVAQLEARNKELVQQILDLQYERDFYKKKITEWTEGQRIAPEPSIAAKAESEGKAPQPPQYIPLPLGGYQIPAYGQPGIAPADSLLNSARISLNRGNFDEALRQFAEMTNVAGCGSRHYLEYGSLLYKLGNFPQAHDILNLVVGNDSLMALAAYYKGRIYQEQNSSIIAEIEYRRSRVLSRGFNGYLVARGYQHLINDQPDSAALIFRQALLVTPELQAEIYAGLAEVSYLNGDRNCEIDLLQQSLGHDPTYIVNIFNLGVALFDAGEYQSAQTFFNRVEKYSQADLDVQFYLGQICYYLQQWDAALEHFLHTDQQKQADSQLAIWLAKTYYIKSLVVRAGGNHFEATNYFRKAREIYPDAGFWMQAALSDLAGICENSKNYNSALEYYSRKLRLDPDDSQTLLKLGVTYYQAGDIKTARELLIKTLKYPAAVAQAEIWLKQIDSFSTN